VYGSISRAKFERLLARRLDKVRVGTAQRAKALIGASWRGMIDDMYTQNAERLIANQFAIVMTECADMIVQLVKSIQSNDRR